MKKITLMVLRKPDIAGPPAREVTGYLFEHSCHPGRQFAIVKLFKVSGRPKNTWGLVDVETGIRVTKGGEHTTREGVVQQATTELFKVPPEEVNAKLERALIRRATRILQEAP